MPGLAPGIHTFPSVSRRTWMAGTSPAMTKGRGCACDAASPLHDRHMRADRNAIVEIDDVLVEQADAARRHRMPDALRLVGAVQAEIGVVAVAIEIERAGAERIFQPAFQAGGIGAVAR